MKTKLLLVLCSASIVACPALSVLADDTTTTVTANPDSSQTQRDRDEAMTSRRQRLGHLNEANKIVGMEIQDDRGERLGKVKDLALDLQNGRIVEVIVARGGTLGIDEKLTAVPPSAFSFAESTKALRLNVDREQLKNAPDIQWSHWKETTQDSQVREVYQRYNVQPYYGQSVAWNGTTNEINSVNNNSTLTGTNSALGTNVDTASASNARAQDNRGQASHYYPNNGTNSFDNQGNYAFASETRPLMMGEVMRASKVMGSTVVNNLDEKIGKVKNLIVDLRGGRVVEVILASGGFLGMDSELSAVPPQSFKLDGNNETLALDTTREALKSAPHFKGNEWETANNPDHISEVYSSYHVQPYFTDRSAADNTAQNVRDRNGNTTTPLNQGNSKEDINTTAQIRKAIMADSNLSVNAHNVKIITANGQVTLRGVVNTDEEKRTIAEEANKVATTDKVDNQIEVRRTPVSTKSSTDSTTPDNK